MSNVLTVKYLLALIGELVEYAESATLEGDPLPLCVIEAQDVLRAAEA